MRNIFFCLCRKHKLINRVMNWDGGQLTVFRPPHFGLTESGYSGAGGGRHGRLHGGKVLSIPQVSQHVLELRPVRSWRRRKQNHGVRRRSGIMWKEFWEKEMKKQTLAKWKQLKWEKKGMCWVWRRSSSSGSAGDGTETIKGNKTRDTKWQQTETRWKRTDEMWQLLLELHESSTPRREETNKWKQVWILLRFIAIRKLHHCAVTINVQSVTVGFRWWMNNKASIMDERGGSDSIMSVKRFRKNALR